MTRLLIWGGVALALHAVLLLVPIYDNSLESAPSSGGVSVHIQTSQISAKANTGEQVLPEPQQADLAEADSAQHGEVSEVEAISVTPVPKDEFNPSLNKYPDKASDKQHVISGNLKSNVKLEGAITTARAATNKPKAVAEKTIESTVRIAQKTPENLVAKASDSSVDSTPDITKSDNHKSDFSRKTRLISARPASQNKPKYPRRAIIRNQQGDVKVELLIKHDGFVEEAVLVESSGFAMLDKSVMKFVNAERFIAALENGMPVDSTQLYTYRFILE